MSEVTVEPPKVLTPSERFVQAKADRAAAQTPEAIAAKTAEAEKPAPAAGEPEKRLSGDERKFRRLLSKRDQEIGELRARLDAAVPKPAAAAAAAAPDAGAAPKRADFPAGAEGDEKFEEARIAHGVAKALEKTDAEKAQAREVADTLTAYNELISKGPEKYPDWNEVLEAGKGGALSVDLGKECPSLLWAIASSPYADDCFYAWLKDSTKLQALIDTYKSGPKGELAAITAFHRFEGQVGKDKPAEKKAEVKAAPAKADDAAPKAAKPKPSAEASVRGGAPAPDGKPPIYLPGTHTLNPAYKAWQKAQAHRN